MTIVSFLVFLIIVGITAATGILFKPGDWYRELNKPSWTPPNWMFPVVWSMLYLLIAIAGWFVFETVGSGGLLALWALQMLLNMAWSYLFFGRHNIFAGLVDIVLLFLVIVAFILLAFSAVPVAGILFLPYLLWVALALALNYQIWRLNAAV